MTEESVTSKFIGKHWLISAVFGAVALIAIAAGIYYYMQFQSAQSLLKNPNLAVEKQTNALVTQVSKLMMLPTDEVPTVATVTDASKLKDQAFFKNAKNGDKVLIYVKARQAILYDPTINIIVAVAPVNISNNQAVVEPSPAVRGATISPTPLVTEKPSPTIVTPTAKP